MTAAVRYHLTGHDLDRELIVTVPGVKVLSESNLRGCWRSKWARGKRQQFAVGLALNAALGLEPMTLPLVVMLTRLIGAGGRILDDDNNVGGCKAIRDAVAACLGIDDGDPAMTWSYAQRKAGAWGIEVRIRRASAKEGRPT